jgi:hypothetical protein
MQIDYDEYSDSITVYGEFDGEQFSVTIPVAALASWSELLGYENQLDTLEAIIHSRRYPTDEHDLWTDVYAILAYREQEREKEHLAAEQEGTATDPRSPLLRSTMRAYHCLPRDNNGDCVLDQCRRAVRDKLGVQHPERNLSVVRPATLIQQNTTERVTTQTTCNKTERIVNTILTDDDRAVAERVLAEHLADIDTRRSWFQHTQTPNKENPLPPAGVAPEPEPTDPEQASLQRLLGTKQQSSEPA